VIMPGNARRRANATEGDAVNGDSPWRQAAACRDIDPDLFFPIGAAGSGAAAQIAEAKRICWTCPVRTPCLGWAIKHYQDYGIWGGMTERERQALRAAITLGRRRRSA
jgi:WhiB family transcriptional regulator, redox-sensing transcriptional regulator